MAQRLVRRLCMDCREIADIPAEALLEAGFSKRDVDEGLEIYKPIGCSKCTNGYRGRQGIFELVAVSDAMERLILEGANAMQLAAQARKEGYDDLRTSGLRKVKAGVTSLEEVYRVTQD